MAAAFRCTVAAEEGRIGQSEDGGGASLEVVGRVSDGHPLQVLRSVLAALLIVARDADSVGVGTPLGALFGLFLFLLLFLGFTIARRLLLLLIALIVVIFVLAGPHLGSPTGRTIFCGITIASAASTDARTDAKTGLGRQPRNARLGLAPGPGILNAPPGGLLVAEVGRRSMDGLRRLAPAGVRAAAARRPERGQPQFGPEGVGIVHRQAELLGSGGARLTGASRCGRLVLGCAGGIGASGATTTATVTAAAYPQGLQPELGPEGVGLFDRQDDLL
mmetsp:Transcript_31371/g.91924  ORF Transcript_31371/g.91924 Transcript_31371/m.91924 type:complete len:276 (-) Transcript_31371:70-897(-)